MEILKNISLSIASVIRQMLFFDNNNSKELLDKFKNSNTHDSIMSDWKAIGGDMRKAIDKISHE